MKAEYGERSSFLELFLNDETLGICLRALGNGFQCFSAVNLMDLVSECVECKLRGAPLVW